MVALPNINIVSSSFFFFFWFSICALHIRNFLLNSLLVKSFQKLRGPSFRRTSWRRTCCAAEAGWCSSSDQSPDRCPSAIRLRPAAGGQSFCLWSDCLMTRLQLQESHSSWSLFPGRRVQACVTEVWSSERLLRENNRFVICESEQTCYWSLRLITAKKKPDVNECERRLLWSQSWLLDPGEWGEWEVFGAADSLWVTVCFKPSSSSSRGRTEKYQKQKSWATTHKTLSAGTDLRRLHADLWCPSSNVVPDLPLVVHTTPAIAIPYLPWWLEHLSQESETLQSSVTIWKGLWTQL